MSDWSDEKIMLACLLIGFGLALPRGVSWFVMVVAAVGAIIFAFVIDPHDSPMLYWIAAMLTGLVLGGFARRAGNLISGKRATHGHG